MIKIIFDRETLLVKLKLLASILPKKASLAAYEQFLFNIVGEVATVTSTDGHKQITISCDTVKCDGNVKFTVLGKLLFSTLGLLLDSEVKLSVKENQVQLKCGRSTYKMASENGESYPMMAEIKSDFEASFNGAIFNEALETAKRYIDPDSSVVAYQGVNLNFLDGKMNISGIQGGHAMCKIVSAPRSVNKWEPILIPASAVKAIVTCVSDSDIVDITHDKQHLEVRTGTVSIMALALDIKYPNIEELYKNNDRKNCVTFNTLQFLNALERLLPYARKEFPLLVIDMKTVGTALFVDNVDFSRDGLEELDVMAATECKLGVNLDFMINSIKSFTNDEFNLFFIDANKPFFLEPVNIVKDNYKFILLAPCKIN